MTTAILPQTDPRTVDQFWIEIVRHYQEAKAFARCGQTEHAQSLLRDTLPSAIRNWSRQSGLPRQLQILRLRKLLRGDLKMVLRPRVSQNEQPSSRAIIRQITEELSPIQTKAPSDSAHRIRLTDISGMIDSVHLAEAQSRALDRRESLPKAS